MKEGEKKRREFDAIAMPLMDALYGTAVYLCRDREEASDLLQDTYLRAYRSWHQFTPGTNCKAWLSTILYNTFRNRWRARRHQPSGDTLDPELLETRALDRDEPEGVLRNPEALLVRNVLDAEVQQALEELPEEFRSAILLIDLQELTYEEAAVVMDCPIGTIRSRLSRGRRLLYRALEPFARERGLVGGKK